MHRLYLDQFGGDRVQEGEVFIGSEDTAVHVKALRLRVGENVEFISFEEKKIYVAAFYNKEQQSLGVFQIQHVDDVLAESPVVHLFQATPKLAKLDEVAQRSVEAGVHGIYIVSTEHSDHVSEKSLLKQEGNRKGDARRKDEKGIVKECGESSGGTPTANKKMERLRKIVLSATMQSKAAVLPEVVYRGNLRDIDFSEYDEVLFFYEQATEALSGISGAKKIAIIIGSEGGFSQAEARWASKNFRVCSLGKRILRTETAAIPAIALTIHEANRGCKNNK